MNVEQIRIETSWKFRDVVLEKDYVSELKERRTNNNILSEVNETRKLEKSS